MIKRKFYHNYKDFESKIYYLVQLIKFSYNLPMFYALS